jgi:3,4-dihydroxy 2-butanone 4-phosphate synthase/GTP cyclohydrolase II
LLESLLKELSNWKNTERVGIIKTDNYEKLLHPSQNILTEEKKISELSKFESSPLFDWNLKEKISTIVWK